jgi:hypothetical protein
VKKAIKKAGKRKKVEAAGEPNPAQRLRVPAR